MRQITKDLNEIAAGPSDGAVFCATLLEIKEHCKDRLDAKEVLTEVFRAVSLGEIEIYDGTSEDINNWQFSPLTTPTKSDDKFTITFECDSKEIQEALLQTLTSDGVEQVICDPYMADRGFKIGFSYEKCWENYGATEEQVKNPTITVKTY